MAPYYWPAEFHFKYTALNVILSNFSSDMFSSTIPRCNETPTVSFQLNQSSNVT